MGINGKQREELKTYFEELKDYDLLTKEQEVELAKRIEDGDVEAKNTMITANLRLVISIVGKYHTANHCVSDIISEGNMGLIKAVDKFDYTLGFRFSTYATNWIKLYIKQAITNNSQTIKIPSYMIEHITSYQKAKTTLQNEYNQVPTPEEIADEMGISSKRINKIISSINLLDNYNTGDRVVECEVAEDNPLFDTDDQALILDLLSDLKERDQLIANHFFGLNGYERLDGYEIGDKLGLTDSAIYKIKDQILERLKWKYEYTKENPMSN